MTQLNHQQEAIADSFLQHLFNKSSEMIISGPGGVGKTFLMAHMIDQIMPRYSAMCSMMNIEPEYTQVTMTATTNKAAEVLAQSTKRPAQTIHSFLNLKVQDDFSTGQSKLIKSGGFQVYQNQVIFIDESPLIDSQLYRMSQEALHNCKIVYVGDYCQLSPVMEKISPIYQQNLPIHELTIPVRNANSPALVKTCHDLREAVKLGVPTHISLAPGQIDWLTDEQVEAEICANFASQNNSRILAYTNKRVTQFNDFIRALRQYSQAPQVGETLINNSMVIVGKQRIYVEEEVTIAAQEAATRMVPVTSDLDIEVLPSTLVSSHGNVLHDVLIPRDINYYNELIRYFKKIKNWNRYFYLKNTFPDLRQRDASTIHKSQGSTYDTVYIDLTNLSTCPQPDLAARLLYVAFSRAKTRVVLFGSLAQKYGTIS